MPPGVTPPIHTELARAAELGMELAYWAQRTPDALAILAPPAQRTFRELNAEANRLARALHRAGLRAGETVALISPNCVELAVALYACRRIGVCCMPITARRHDDEIAYIMNDSGARALIADAQLGERLTTIAQQCERATIRIAFGGAVPDFSAYESALSAEDASNLEAPQRGWLMTHTSSISRPVGVVRTHRGPKPPSRALRAARYEHGSGQLVLTYFMLIAEPAIELAFFGPLDAGVPVLLTRFTSVEDLLALIERHRVTHLHTLPMTLTLLGNLRAEDRARYDVSSLVHVIHGPKPCRAPTKQAVLDWLGPIVWEYYGHDELIATVIDPPEWLRAPHSVGRGETPDAISIRDEQGKPCAAGELGELWLKLEPHTRFEYHQQPERTSVVIDGDYFHTSDSGYLDAEGRLVLVDRRINLIYTGLADPPFDPAVIEAVLHQHPAVQDIAAVGLRSPHGHYHEVIAVIELRTEQPYRYSDDVEELDAPAPSAHELEGELRALCERDLAPYQHPKRIHFVAWLPRTPIAMLHKRKVREYFEKKL